MRTSSLYLLVLCGIRASWALQNDFSSYPQGSQGCLNDAANQSQCSGNTGQQLNQCLCTNQGNFIYNSGSCVAQKSPKDLESVYDTLQNNCQGTGVTLTVSKQAFLANAAAATSSSATNSPMSSSTSTSSSSPTSDSSSSSSSGLATGAIVGMAVGGVAVIALIGAGIWLLLRRRRAQRPSSVQPHLPPPEASEYTGYNHQSPYNQPTAYNQGPLQQKYAHHEGAAELDNSEYMAAAVPGYSSGKQDAKRHDHSDVPLLAELGNTQPHHEQHTQSSSPAELPADEYMHGGRRPREDV